MGFPVSFPLLIFIEGEFTNKSEDNQNRERAWYIMHVCVSFPNQKPTNQIHFRYVVAVGR